MRTVSRPSSIPVRLLAVCLLLLGLLAGAVPARAFWGDDGVGRGNDLFNQGDYDGVIALLEPVVTADPKASYQVWDLLGKAYFNKGEYAKAAAALESVTAPGMFSNIPFGGRRSDMNSNGWLGWSYFFLKEYGRARGAFDKVLARSSFRRDPSWDFTALRGRAWSRYQQGDFAGAEQDLAAAHRLGEANPAMLTAELKRNINLLLAYLHLAQNRDDRALALATAIAPQPRTQEGRDLAPLYLMLDRPDEAHRLWGGTAFAGMFVVDNRGDGALVAKVADNSPARFAGIQAGDVILALDGRQMRNGRDVLEGIGAGQAGQTVQLGVVRNGKQGRVDVTLGGVDESIARVEILQPVLKVRQLPLKPVELAIPMPEAVAVPAPETGAIAVPPPPSVPALPPVAAQPQVAPTAPPKTPVASSEPYLGKPEPPVLLIDSAQSVPAVVKAGESFEIQVALYAADQALRGAKVSVSLQYAIQQNGKELVRFPAETFELPNGSPSTIAVKTRAAKKPGDYTVAVEVEMGVDKARTTTTFTIQ